MAVARVDVPVKGRGKSVQIALGQFGELREYFVQFVLRRQTAAELELLSGQRERLLSFDLSEQNTKVEFLNSTIAERTFPWSRLFDDLVEAMPREVRLTSLTPRSGDLQRRRDRRRQSRGRPDGAWISLEIQGESSDDDAHWGFVERLFAHPAFVDPSLLSENRESPGLVSFELVARYRTRRPSPTAEDDHRPGTPGDSGAGPAAPETPAEVSKEAVAEVTSLIEPGQAEEAP